MEDAVSEEGSSGRVSLPIDLKLGKRNLLLTNKGHSPANSKQCIKSARGRTMTECDEGLKAGTVSGALPTEVQYSSAGVEELKSFPVEASCSSRPNGDSGKLSTAHMETEDKTPMIRPEYGSIRDNTDPVAEARRIFSEKEYLTEVAECAATESLHRFQAYRYRIEAFAPARSVQYAKDLSLYSRNKQKYNSGIDKKTLCLGLQNVLMSVSTFASEDGDEVISVRKQGESLTSELSVRYRPFLHEFLEDMQSHYELILYSSFCQDYVNALAGAMEKGRKVFVHRFGEEFCVFANIAYSVKCIDFLLGNRSPADIVVLDNSARFFPLTADNVVPIPIYDPAVGQDDELARLGRVLGNMAQEKDVREAVRRYRLCGC